MIVAPIYAAGEEPIPTLHHMQLVNDIMKQGHKSVLAIQSQEELAPTIMTLGSSGDMVVCLGAGSISGWAQTLPEELKEWNNQDQNSLAKRGEKNG